MKDIFGREIIEGNTVLHDSGGILFKKVVSKVDECGDIYYNLIINENGKSVSHLIKIKSTNDQFVIIDDIISCNPEIFI